MYKLATLAVAAATSLSFAAPASAAEPAAPARSVAVGDLSTPAGVAAFDRRMRLAAEAVCGDSPGARALAESMRIRRCIGDVVTSHRPTLQAAAPAAPTA